MKKIVVEFEKKLNIGFSIDEQEKMLTVSILYDVKIYQTYSFSTFFKDLLSLKTLLEK